MPEVSLQYTEVVAWQQQLLQGDRDRFAEQLAYWQRQLAGMPTGLELPTDRSRPTVPTWRGARMAVLAQDAHPGRAGAESAAGGEPVHDTGGSMADLAVSLQWAGGCGARHRHGGSQAQQEAKR